MRKAIIAGASAILLAAIASFAAGGARMKITSSAFQQGANIPPKFSCDGPNTNPPLQIADIPTEAGNKRLRQVGLRRTVSAFGHAPLLLQDFRAGSRAGFTCRREAEPTGHGDEKSCDCKG